MKNGKLLVIGHVARDVTETKTGHGEYWGGAGYHVAMSAAMFLDQSQVIIKSVVGKDFDGDIFRNNGVSTDLLLVKGDQITDVHYMNEVGDSREYSSVGNLSARVSSDELDKVIDEVCWIHLASAPPEQQNTWLDQINKYGKNNVFISVDSFEKFAAETPGKVRDVFARCDLGFLNESEWQSVDGRSLKMKLVRKLGKNGAEIYENGKMEVKVDAPLIMNICDTTGAGDVLAGAYMAKKILGEEDEVALRAACNLASDSVRGYGTDGIRTKVSA